MKNSPHIDHKYQTLRPKFVQYVRLKLKSYCRIILKEEFTNFKGSCRAVNIKRFLEKKMVLNNKMFCRLRNIS